VPVALVVQHRREAGALLSDDVENLSASGLFVRCAEPYTVGTAVELTFGMPGSTLTARGRVVRVGVGASGQDGMGIMFEPLPAETREAVERLVVERLAALAAQA
jgi:uncharacterized protein (TIGR02266 family)